MEQPMFSLASYYGERKLVWKRICNKNTVGKIDYLYT